MPRALIARAIWVLVAILGLAICLRTLGHIGEGDDSWFYMAKALEYARTHADGNLYQTLFFSQHIKFQYPPSSLFWLELLNWAGYDTYREYNTFNAIALIATALVQAQLSTHIIGRRKLCGVAIPIGPIVFLISLRYFPSYFAFVAGQIQVQIGFLFALSCLAMLYDRRMLAGCLVALIVLFKPQLVPILLLAIWQGDRRFVIGFLALTGVLLAVAIARYGVANHIGYLSVLSFLSHHGEYQHDNQSIFGLLVRWLYRGPIAPLDHDPMGPIDQTWFPPYIPAVYFISTAISAILVAAPFLLPRSEGNRIPLPVFVTAAVLCTLASPVAWIYHYNVLVPAFILVTGYALQLSGRARVAHLVLIAVSFALTAVSYFPVFAPDCPSLNLLETHFFFGAALLAGLAIRACAYPPTWPPNLNVALTKI